jgi:hypothetical protein
MWHVALRAEDEAMPAGLNVALSVFALLAAISFRFAHLALTALVAIVFVYPLIAVLLPLIQALSTVRKGVATTSRRRPGSSRVGAASSRGPPCARMPATMGRGCQQYARSACRSR